MRTFLFVILALLHFCCNQNKASNDTPAAENKFTNTDKIVYTYNEGTYPGALKYKITVTPEEVVFKLEAASQAEKIEKTYPFTEKKWDKLLASFENLRIKGEATNDCDGGGSEGLTFYKDGEKTEAAHDYHCGKESRNFSGAELSLTHLIKNFDELKATLLQKNESGDEPDADDEYKWTAAERKAYKKECIALLEDRKEGKRAAYYCNCTLGHLQIAYATKKEAQRAIEEEMERWLEKCSTRNDE